MNNTRKSRFSIVFFIFSGIYELYEGLKSKLSLLNHISVYFSHIIENQILFLEKLKNIYSETQEYLIKQELILKKK